LLTCARQSSVWGLSLDTGVILLQQAVAPFCCRILLDAGSDGKPTDISAADERVAP
jgi:hypothetical protein